MDDRWRSAGEISDYLRVSKDTVYTWSSEKDTSAHRAGRLGKFKRVEVDGWVKFGGPADRQDVDPGSKEGR